MYITQEYMHVFFQQVHQNVAKRCGIENYEWKSTSELADEIQKLNSKVAGTVKVFIEAYESWLKVHEEIDAAGNAGNLTTDQNEKLMKAISTRDSTRKNLVDELARL